MEDREEPRGVGMAVLGCGRIDAMHAADAAAHSCGPLAAAQDISRAAAAFSSPDVDAAPVVTATDIHADLLEQAGAAGKPVHCKNPVDLSFSRANRCAETTHGATKPIQSGFVRRYDPGRRAARDAVRCGEIDELHQAIVASCDPGLAPEACVRVSGGLMRDMTIHDFGIARYKLRAKPIAVSATASRLVARELMQGLDDCDTVAVAITTASGKQAIITNSREAAYGCDQWVEAFGTNGMAASESRRPHHMVLPGDGFSERAASLLHVFIERCREAFDAEIDSFVESATTGRLAVVGSKDGRLAPALIEAATRLISEGRAVKISEVD